MESGLGIPVQIDAMQDRCEFQIIVLSPDYLASKYCMHELNRATAKDPTFERGVVVPIMRVACEFPPHVAAFDPFYLDMRDDAAGDCWEKLLHKFHATLRVDAGAWLHARDETSRLMLRGHSINLLVSHHPKWEELLRSVCRDLPGGLPSIDLQEGSACTRHGLVLQILQALGISSRVPKKRGEDLRALTQLLSRRTPSYLAITHFDLVQYRSYYGVDLFCTLNGLMRNGSLVACFVSRAPFLSLVPIELSQMEVLQVRLEGYPC
jgi:hypothetical protein